MYAKASSLISFKKKNSLVTFLFDFCPWMRLFNCWVAHGLIVILPLASVELPFIQRLSTGCARQVGYVCECEARSCWQRTCVLSCTNKQSICLSSCLSSQNTNLFIWDSCAKSGSLLLSPCAMNLIPVSAYWWWDWLSTDGGGTGSADGHQCSLQGGALPRL